MKTITNPLSMSTDTIVRYRPFVRSKFEEHEQWCKAKANHYTRVNPGTWKYFINGDYVLFTRRNEFWKNK